MGVHDPTQTNESLKLLLRKSGKGPAQDHCERAVEKWLSLVKTVSDIDLYHVYPVAQTNRINKAM